MNIDIKFDLTPEELRTFFGLPDVKPLQDEMLQKLRERMQAGVEKMDPMALMQPFLVPNLSAMEATQKAFSQSFTEGTQKKTEE